MIKNIFLRLISLSFCTSTASTTSPATATTSTSSATTSWAVPHFHSLSCSVELFGVVFFEVSNSSFRSVTILNISQLKASCSLSFTDSFLQSHYFVFFNLEQWKLFSQQVLNSLIKLDIWKQEMGISELPLVNSVHCLTILRHNCHGFATSACSSSSSHSMDVILAVCWDVEVNNHVDVRNVETSVGAKEI